MRKVVIGDINGKAKECQEFLQKNSEDRLVFSVVSNQSLVDGQLTANENSRHKMPYIVPFLNQYQGIVLYIESTFESKIDIDMLFSYQAFNDVGPRVYFVKHHAWIIDCGSPENASLNPFYVDQNDAQIIKTNYPFNVVDSI